MKSGTSVVDAYGMCGPVFPSKLVPRSGQAYQQSSCSRLRLGHCNICCLRTVHLVADSCSCRPSYVVLSSRGARLAKSNDDNSVVTSDKGGGTCFCPCLSVCLSVSKITKTRGWIWMKCCVSTDVWTWTN